MYILHEIPINTSLDIVLQLTAYQQKLHKYKKCDISQVLHNVSLLEE